MAKSKFGPLPRRGARKKSVTEYGPSSSEVLSEISKKPDDSEQNEHSEEPEEETKPKKPAFNREVIKEQPAPKQEKKEDNEEIELSDDEIEETLKDSLNYSPEPWDTMFIDILATDARRKKIESRITDNKIDVQRIMTTGNFEQTVTLYNDYKVTFRLIPKADDQFVNGLLWDKDFLKRAFDISSDSGFGYSEKGAQFLVDFMRLALAVESFNGKRLPSIRNEDNKLDKENFLLRMRELSRLPNIFVTDLSVNYYWFEQRIRRSVILEELKNG